MKLLMEGTGGTTFILVMNVRQIQNENGKVWTDKENMIGRCKHQLRYVEVLVPLEGQDSVFPKYESVRISKADLWELMNKIAEAEKVETDEIID
jgi:hypothetical protein